MRTVIALAIALTLLSLALAANAADTPQPKVNSEPPAADSPREEAANDRGEGQGEGQGEGNSKSVQPPPTQPPASPASSPSTTNRQPSTAARRSTDRLELDTTVVTGNRELPKVLYIVPWKKADIGDLPAQPFNTLLDEALMPIDRDVFRREVTYYDAVSSGANTPGATADSPAAGPEK